MAYVLVWRFDVKPEHLHEFKQHYGPDGSWAGFFRADPAYVRTELLQSLERPTEFLTLDYWRTKEDYVRFQSGNREAYSNLDRTFERLTVSEERLGGFDA